MTMDRKMRAKANNAAAKRAKQARERKMDIAAHDVCCVCDEPGTDAYPLMRDDDGDLIHGFNRAKLN
jgi:hypothetical protein